MTLWTYWFCLWLTYTYFDIKFQSFSVGNASKPSILRSSMCYNALPHILSYPHFETAQFGSDNKARSSNFSILNFYFFWGGRGNSQRHHSRPIPQHSTFWNRWVALTDYAQILTLNFETYLGAMRSWATAPFLLLHLITPLCDRRLHLWQECT